MWKKGLWLCLSSTLNVQEPMSGNMNMGFFAITIGGMLRL